MREQVAEQLVEETAPPKPAGVQRMTLVLTKGVASRIEEATCALRDQRCVSFGALTEAALESTSCSAERLTVTAPLPDFDPLRVRRRMS